MTVQPFLGTGLGPDALAHHPGAAVGPHPQGRHEFGFGELIPPLQRRGVLWRHRRLYTREQVFDGEYPKAGEFPERHIEHATTGGLFFLRGRGLG